MTKRILLSFIFFFIVACNVQIYGQSSSCYTSYTWDRWTDQALWKYCYSDGWVYVYPSYKNPKDFYFRFKYKDLGLHELSRSEWKSVKQNGGWVERYCTFEYYITDQYQTMKSCLQDYGYPCAKEKVGYGMPSVLKSENVRTRISYADDDEVRALNFWFSDGSALAISVHWDYSGYNMQYTY